MYAELQDKDYLHEHYVEQEKSTAMIAEEVGCSAAAVQLALKRHEIPRRGRWSGRWSPKPCVECGTEFTPSGPAAKFCSDRCKNGVAECEQCGEAFVLDQHGRKTYCSRECWYDSQRDQTRDHVNGYRLVWVGKDDPDAMVDGRMFEHRYVMREHLGRSLEDHEQVHHIDGDKANNDLSNLELWDRNHPQGTRQTDTVRHCKTCTCDI